MKLISSLIVGLFLCANAFAANVFSNKTLVTTAAHSGTSVAVDTTGTNFLAVEVVVFVPRVPTLTDSRSNTWTAHAQSPKTVNSDVTSYVFYVLNPLTNASHTFTVTLDGAATDTFSFYVAGNSGRATSSAIEGANYAADASAVTSHVGGATGAITAGDDVLVFAYDDNAAVSGSSMTWTAGSGLTMAAGAVNGDGRFTTTGGIEHADNVAGTSILGNWTTSAATIGGSYTLAIKAAAAPSFPASQGFFIGN